MELLIFMFSLICKIVIIGVAATFGTIIVHLFWFLLYKLLELIMKVIFFVKDFFEEN